MAHDSWPDFENVLLRFEAAWNSEQPPDLDEFVAQQPGCLSDDLLVELCLIDMERRLQRGLGAAAEDFLQRYPHWGAALRRKLVVGEIEIRFWTAHAVTQAELNRRFPDLCPDLNSLLSPAAPAGSDEGRPPLRVGARVGRFVLGRELGAGAFSVVYSARDSDSGQTVALKVLQRRVAGDDTLRERVLREARAVTTVHSRNIVRVLEVGSAGELDFVVSEFVDGPTLEQCLGEARFSTSESARIVHDLARAIELAHRQGTVHRDIKPANILMKGSTPLVTDFGLAHLSDATHELTHEGDLVGTPSYMAPEQAAGQGWLADPRCDVYSLGVVLYRMLTGELPFSGSTTEVLSQVLHAAPRAPRSLVPGVPRELEIITLKCMEKDPADRYQSAAALADDLERQRQGRAILAQPPGMRTRLLRWARRRPALAASAGAIMLLLAFLVGSILQLGRVVLERDRARQAESKAVHSGQEAERLLARASESAGTLAFQRGRFREAIGHFDQALLRGHPDPVALRLAKIDALLAVRRVSDARRELGLLSAGPGSVEHRPLVLAYQAEVALESGNDSRRAEELFRKATQGSGLADQAFLDGMLAADSLQALACFRLAVQRDPFHRRARRMLVTVLASLAEFDAAEEEARRAGELFVEDQAFLLLQVLAASGSRRRELASALLEKASLPPAEAAAWGEFCESLSEFSLDLGDDKSSLNLARISRFASRFQSEFRPLLARQGLHLPVTIGGRFDGLPELLASQDVLRLPNRLTELNPGPEAELIRRVEDGISALVEVHPEGSLLALLGHLQFARGDLKRSRDTLLAALERPAWMSDANQHVRVNLATAALVLGILRNQDREQNLAVLVTAVRDMDPEVLAASGEFRAICIGLLEANETDLAARFAQAWVTIPGAGEDAWWHLAVAEQRRENWVSVIHHCDRVLALNAAHSGAAALRSRARQQLAALVAPTETKTGEGDGK